LVVQGRSPRTQGCKSTVQEAPSLSTEACGGRVDIRQGSIRGLNSARRQYEGFKKVVKANMWVKHDPMTKAELGVEEQACQPAGNEIDAEGVDQMSPRHSVIEGGDRNLKGAHLSFPELSSKRFL